MLISDGRRLQPTSKKNRRLVLAGASQEGEPRSEIPLMQVFHWSQPGNQPYDSTKVVES